jgi:hypothetical protein
MGKSNPQQPQPVVINPGASATGQASFNKEAALQQRALNMVDQYTPQGTTKYEATGSDVEGIPQYKVTQELSPEQQRLYDLSTGTAEQYGEIAQTQLGNVKSSFESPFSLDSLGAAPTVNETTRNSTRDAMLQRLDPQYEKDRAALETSLTNQGFTVGTEAYNNAMDEFNRMKNDAYLAADIASGNEMARMYGLETSARDRTINEMLMQRQQPLAELSAFISGSQPSMPGFLAAPQGQIAAPDVMGAQYASANMTNSANQNAYNQQMGQYNSNLNGLYGLGAAGLGAAGYAWGR